MESSTLRAHLIDEADLLKRAVAVAGPAARVPTCPDWTVADLLDHVTEVYDDKLQCVRLLREPGDADVLVRKGSPTERFEAALAELLTEFDGRGPDSLAYTWYGPDQTVGFWIRRMACETVVHRADAELAAGRAIGPVEDDFGLDAVDEFLTVMLAWGSRANRQWVAESLAANAGLVVAIDAGERAWTVRVTADGIDLVDGVAEDAQAAVSGTPGEVLMWLWRRLPADALVEGDRAKADAFHDLIGQFAD
ncbi:maleylpyruvate isomerase family mycothiol-dependent enzyme [Glycomyces sp. L485]|uniref:maleylpyruvate isomerase family mycothiol-dependent enzyme n=1 Tax=Glycomyces sp. L485 TaxID=2909235 RepID=UPI001F4B2577|nr:maleylpyruvate isomerase family mycothiol-dependent enzyme [Glycomyces sp. L485]MCH7230335.1 maleylpyruvate isomerase family mycothiol-dependent enzyme [Glycomyces sp. L485]